MDKLLSVEELKSYFFTDSGIVRAVDGVSFQVSKGEALGISGESGSGKSVTALSIMRLLPRTGKIMGGRIIFDGEDLLEKSEKQMRDIRGSKIAMIFQSPSGSFSPLFTVGVQLMESIMAHQRIEKSEAREKALKLLQVVGVSNIDRRMDQLPSMWSGGMLQRAAIARALAGNPELLIADEPTTSLDVTIQAQILEELKRLKDKMNLSLVLITHDMGVLAEVTQSLVVMYAGMVLEAGRTSNIFRAPQHPYTAALLKSTPRVDKRTTPETIPGELPSTINPPLGCRFHPRCRFRAEICDKKVPELRPVSGSQVSCHFAGELDLKGVS